MKLKIITESINFLDVIGIKNEDCTVFIDLYKKVLPQLDISIFCHLSGNDCKCNNYCYNQNN